MFYIMFPMHGECALLSVCSATLDLLLCITEHVMQIVSYFRQWHATDETTTRRHQSKSRRK